MKIYDVSHNPAAVALLAERLHDLPCVGKTRAVFSMLADKDISASIQAILPLIDTWYVASLVDKRAASIEKLKSIFQEAKVREVRFFSSIKAAYEIALQQAEKGDRVVVFGSFHTVSEAFKK